MFNNMNYTVKSVKFIVKTDSCGCQNITVKMSMSNVKIMFRAGYFWYEKNGQIY